MNNKDDNKHNYNKIVKFKVTKQLLTTKCNNKNNNGNHEQILK